jgi:hypothetical protein
MGQDKINRYGLCKDGAKRLVFLCRVPSSFVAPDDLP